MKKECFVFIGIFIGMLSGCSSTPQNLDPHENFNRDMMCFNVGVDKSILKPVATGYETITTEPIRRSISSFLYNCNEPLRFVNYVLQGDADQFTNTLFRFLINTTVGFLGLFDVASELGLEKRDTTYKDTLKKWEMPIGDYLTLPVLSSSSTRDVIAEPVSWFADPVTYVIGWPCMLAKAFADAVDDRLQNGKVRDDLIKNSTDPYPLMRDMYMRKYGNMPNPVDADDDDDDDEK